MAIPVQTLRELRAFLLSDFVQIKGTQIPLLTGFIGALANEEQLQLNQQSVKERTSTAPARNSASESAPPTIE